MQHLQPNTTLQGGKYKIERVLGQGGFGITYLAMQTSLQRKIAIKEFFMKEFCSRDEATMTPFSGSSKQVEQYRKKFIKEATNLARLNHPNIISVIDVFEENGTVYYAMPYLVGGSLQDYVKAHGTLSEIIAMKYVRQIAGALKYMHEKEHICHYDVKPGNIMLDDNGNAVLIDFGISKNYDAAGHETTTTPVGMSEGYAPIEQYQQNVEEFSPVSDVYALGATLYFLLHGKRPVSAVSRASGATLLMRTQLSQGVKDIIKASMKVSKRERANSVDVFLKEGYTNNLSGDESTIIDRGGHKTTKVTQPYSASTTNFDKEDKNKKELEAEQSKAHKEVVDGTWVDYTITFIVFIIVELNDLNFLEEIEWLQKIDFWIFKGEWISFFLMLLITYIVVGSITEIVANIMGYKKVWGKFMPLFWIVFCIGFGISIIHIFFPDFFFPDFTPFFCERKY